MATKKTVSDSSDPILVEVQISIVPRGKSTVHATIVRSSGALVPVKQDLDSFREEEVKKLVSSWFKPGFGE